jgi:hypothetical protein
VELVEDEHLPVPLDRGQRGDPDDLLDLLFGDGGADAVDLTDIGCSPAAASRASRPAGSPVGSRSRAAKARAAWSFVLPAGPTKR